MKKLLFIAGILTFFFFLIAIASLIYVLVPYHDRTAHNIPAEKLIEIRSFDGLKLSAEQIFQGNQTNLWALLIHSYRTDHTVMYRYGQFYLSHGYNVLYPDNRAHGNSEGIFIGMGYLDRLDILSWVRYILSINPDAQIIIHGLSMGAAAALCFSGLDYAELDHVIAIISDASYKSAESYLSEKLKKKFHLPAFPLIPILNLASKVATGYALSDASPMNFIGKSNIPTLIIHGSLDESVSVNDAYVLYNSARMRKELLIIPDAGHTHSLKTAPETYLKTIQNFIETSN